MQPDPFIPHGDVLNMLALSQFDQPEEYYCTLFHELKHSTSHITRLNREGSAGSIKSGSEDYAHEELKAKMSAPFPCAHTGIDVESITEKKVTYLAAWLKLLQDDRRLVLKAAAGAQKAADYLLNVQR